MRLTRSSTSAYRKSKSPQHPTLGRGKGKVAKVGRSWKYIKVVWLHCKTPIVWKWYCVCGQTWDASQAEAHRNKPTLTQEYANLDKASRSTEQYLRKRLDELKTVYNDIHEMRVAKEEENKYDHPFTFFIPVSSTYFKFSGYFVIFWSAPLHLELRSVTCNGAEENHAHRCDPYDLRVQEQPLFLVCSSINIFTSMGLDP